MVLRWKLVCWLALLSRSELALGLAFGWRSRLGWASRSALVLGLAVDAAAAEAPASAAPSAARGRQLYYSVGCVHCHGGMGQGSSAGARLAPEPLPAAAIAAFIRATNTPMPPPIGQVMPTHGLSVPREAA